MKVWCRGTARIRHGGTGAVHEVDSSALEWEDVDGDERQMGAAVHYEAYVVHPELGPLVWGLWEYPLGAENDRQTSVGPHALIENLEFGLQDVPPDPEDWLDDSIPDSPFAIFTTSYRHTCALIAEQCQDDGAFLLNRMVFSHQVTALEAYLGDTLIQAVLHEGAALQSLLDGDRDLARGKFTLAQISKEPGLVTRAVREHLRSILYHNLPKVSALYNAALGIDLLALAPDRDRLFQIVLWRHDCVHRNGFDKDGKAIDVFSRRFVQEAADLIRDFVERIQLALRARGYEAF